MEADDDQHEVPRNSSLSQAMRRVLFEGQSFCDMVFVCAGGVDEVPAWRMLVAMRSPFLENLLLKWDMAGEPSKRIHLPEIESATMRICLEFFYTDTVQHTSWPDDSILLPMKVIASSHFFLVGELQEVTISFLLRTTPWMHCQHGNEDDICARLAAVPGLLQEVVCAFNLGVQLNQTCACEKLQKVLKRLGRVIDIGLLSYHRLDYQYISHDAMIHLLESQTVSWGDASLWEYSRLQHIVHWCVHKDLLNNDHPVAEEAVIQDIVKCALPWQYKGSFDEIVHAKSLFDGPLDPITKRVIAVLALSVQNSVGVMLRVYLEDIPSIILNKFIKPLGLIPASTLACVRNLQAVDKWKDLRWDDFPDNEGKQVAENVIEFSCNSDQFSGVSPCNLCSKFPGSTTLTWEISLLSPCKVYRLGFGLVRPRRERFDGSNNWFWSLCSFGVLQYNGETRHCEECYSEGYKVRVHIDLYHRKCSFLVNGRNVGASCDNLPLNGQVYPAIYMRKPGKVQVRLLC